jgi:hypothetical protein
MEWKLLGRRLALEPITVLTVWATDLSVLPSLWTQVYIHNEEDETARRSAFPYLLKCCPLQADIMTVASTTDGLQLIAAHISRVATISIGPVYQI